MGKKFSRETILSDETKHKCQNYGACSGALIDTMQKHDFTSMIEIIIHLSFKVGRGDPTRLVHTYQNVLVHYTSTSHEKTIILGLLFLPKSFIILPKRFGKQLALQF